MTRKTQFQDTEILTKVSALLENISKGDFFQELYFTQEEIEAHGELVERSNFAMQKLQQIIQLIDNISSGDYTVDIKPRSEQDRLGIALQRMTEILRNA
ncbi:MAG: hypothetical protein QM479_02400, partial [Pseudomonadota bacterium]